MLGNFSVFVVPSGHVIVRVTEHDLPDWPLILTLLEPGARDLLMMVTSVRPAP